MSKCFQVMLLFQGLYKSKGSVESWIPTLPNPEQVHWDTSSAEEPSAAEPKQRNESLY